MRTKRVPRASRTRAADPETKMMAVDTGEIPVVRFATGSFEAFYQTNRQHVFRALALTLGSSDLAADAVDEAMARAYQHWRSVATFDNQAGWVYRVGLNWARSRLRKRKREVLSERPPEQMTEVTFADPDLERAVMALPLEARSVVVLRFYLDWSTDEVARTLGIRPGTVKSRLHRAMNELRTQLDVKP